MGTLFGLLLYDVPYIMYGYFFDAYCACDANNHVILTFDYMQVTCDGNMRVTLTLLYHACYTSTTGVLHAC